MGTESVILYKLRKHPALKEGLADWFSANWSIPRTAYLESMEACLQEGFAIPQWYVLCRDEEIVAGAGVIENDFHIRPDLRPNVCAVYVEPAYRGQGLARQLLAEICRDMAALGEERLYLLTDHIGFYEKLGWHYLCEIVEQSGGSARVYEKCTKKEQ